MEPGWTLSVGLSRIVFRFKGEVFFPTKDPPGVTFFFAALPNLSFPLERYFPFWEEVPAHIKAIKILALTALGTKYNLFLYTKGKGEK
jgi:hypothetical protein